MNARSWFLNASAICMSVGIAIILFGVGLQMYSGYEPPILPLDWVLSASWVSIGGSVLIHWWCWYSSHRCTRIASYRLEALITNIALLSFALCCLVIGWSTMGFQSYELPACPCADQFYGRLCIPCTCSGHGICDDGIDGTGECYCDARYDGLACDECISHAQNYPLCTCERVWTGAGCESCAVGYNCSTYPNVTCATGWNQTGVGLDGFPVCDACAAGYGGDPSKNCMRCLGGEDTPCNGLGTCWDNDHYEQMVWPQVKDQCTRTFEVCDSHADCATSNCRGVCQSRFAPPVGPSAQWSETFDNTLCSSDADCNFALNEAFEGVLPDEWWDEGRCAERVCCEEHRFGNATCFDCQGAGRFPPACDACPGWNDTIDNDATICNGHGTCVPEIDINNNYVQMMCLCSSTWVEQDCRCNRGPDGLCHSCAQGFYLPADPVLSALAGKGIAAHGDCLPCPGAEYGTGLAACNFLQGYGQCIYADTVAVEHLDRIGTCACTNAIGAPPQIAATGPTCSDAPPGFFTREGNILACPRVLRTGVCNDQSRWETTRLDGSTFETCVEVCGGEIGMVATCDQGTCACNNTDISSDPAMQIFYEQGFNGLCRKKVLLV